MTLAEGGQGEWNPRKDALAAGLGGVSLELQQSNSRRVGVALAFVCLSLCLSLPATCRLHCRLALLCDGRKGEVESAKRPRG